MLKRRGSRGERKRGKGKKRERRRRRGRGSGRGGEGKEEKSKTKFENMSIRGQQRYIHCTLSLPGYRDTWGEHQVVMIAAKKWLTQPPSKECQGHQKLRAGQEGFSPMHYRGTTVLLISWFWTFVRWHTFVCRAMEVRNLAMVAIGNLISSRGGSWWHGRKVAIICWWKEGGEWRKGSNWGQTRFVD